MKLDQDHLNILKNIQKLSKVTQRELAVKLGLSLGKLKNNSWWKFFLFQKVRTISI